MVSWLIGAAWAQEACPIAEETAASFKPRAAEATWGPGGGWSGKQVKHLSSETRDAFKKYKRQFASYPPEAQEDVLAGRLRDDLDEVAAYLAWGAPSWTWEGSERRCRYLLYTDRGAEAVVLSACDGATDGLFEIEADLSCARLSSVVPRLEKRTRQLEGWDTEQAIAVLAGVPQPWMTADELELAFGKPDRKREGGTQLLFLADDGLHEGPTVTLVDDHVDTWSFPEGERLTRTGERTLRKEAREADGGGGSSAGRAALGLLKAVALIGLAAAAEGLEDGSGGGGTVEQQSYSNRVRLACNGDVLYDREFTDRQACLAAEASTELHCGGVRMRFGC
jgi:hypothetical protein